MSAIARAVPRTVPVTFERPVRLVELGLRTRLLDSRRDVDTWADAVAVAADAPDTGFAATVRGLAVPVA